MLRHAELVSASKNVMKDADIRQHDEIIMFQIKTLPNNLREYRKQTQYEQHKQTG